MKIKIICGNHSVSFDSIDDMYEHIEFRCGSKDALFSPAGTVIVRTVFQCPFCLNYIERFQRFLNGEDFDIFRKRKDNHGLIKDFFGKDL